MAQTRHDDHREPVRSPDLERHIAAAEAEHKEMPEEDAARLRELRAERDNERTPPLSDKDHAELQKLGAREAELAGHRVERVEVPDVHPHVMLVSNLFGLVERIIDKTPAYADLMPAVYQLRADIFAASAPEKK